MTESGNAHSGPGRFAAAGAIVAAGCAVYLPVVHGGWLWDDSAEVVANPALRNVHGLGAIWKGTIGDDYFPLKSTFQWIEWHLWGAHVEGYHLVNLALHLASAFLLWRLLGKLGLRFGWVGGLVWTIHPVAVESVAWISEFKNTLSALFLFLSAIAYLDVGRGRGGSRFRYALALLWFLAALLSKSSVVMFPAILCLYKVLWNGKPGWVRTAPFFLLSSVLGAVTIWFQDHRILERTAMAVAPLGDRILGAFSAAAFYVSHLVAPVHEKAVYPAWTNSVRAGEVAVWIILVGVTAVAWRRRSTWGKGMILGLAVMVLSLVPVLGLIPFAYSRIAPVADHFAHLSLAGFAGLAAAGFERAWSRSPRAGRVLMGFGGGCLIGGFALGAALLVPKFKSDRALWTVAVRDNPDSWLAHNNLALDLLADSQIPAAIGEIRAAETLRPGFPEVRANAGAVLLDAGHVPEALAESEEAVRLGPSLAGAHMTLGRAYLAEGRLDEASRELTAALRLDPGNAATYNNLGILDANRGDWPGALKDYGTAITLDPSNAEAWNNRGSALGHLGRWEEAIAHDRQALRLRPHFPQCENNLGNALAASGRPEAALAHYQSALDLSPNDPGTHRNLALALHALGRDGEAQVQIQEAEKLSQRP